MSEIPVPAPRVSVLAMLLDSGPRFTRDSIAPPLAFYAAWKLFGLTAGSAVAFFAPGVLVNALYGLAFVASVMLGRPLAVLTGAPFTAALTTWSIWYGVRGFRRRAEWGWALRIVVLALIAGVAAPVFADDAGDIVREADRFRRPADSFVWKITITSQEARKAPTVDAFEVFVKGNGRSLVKFVAPPRNVGRSLLALGRDLWIYLPDAGKPVRIPFSQRLVGQVSNGDVARADYAGDYDATLAGEETVDGVACHVIDLKAKTKDVTYAAVKYWVSKHDRRPVRAEFYAGTGTLLKTGTFEVFKEVAAGRPLATRLTLVDGIRKDRRSVMDFGEVIVRDVPEKYFDKNSMKSLD